MKLYCCQFNIIWEDKDANFKKVERLIEQQSVAAGSLVVLPEMSFTGFSMDVPKIAKGEPEVTESFLRTLAKRHGVYLISGLVTQASDRRGRNEAVYVNPEGSIGGRFRKLHLFSPADEDSFYEPGSGVITFPWEGALIAPFICYDLRFPDVFRTAVNMGAELCIVIANWPSGREHHWVTLLQARAIENQAFVAGVNRCGSDPTNEYPGRSLIISPTGEILADAAREEALIGSDLDWAALRHYRERFPVLADRRSDLSIDGWPARRATDPFANACDRLSPQQT
jgi:omega-amidase